MESPMSGHARELSKTPPGKDPLQTVAELTQASIADEGLVEAPRPPYRSLWGALKDLGPAPSAEVIDEARQEAWANFPREHFYE
jgi:hypothetical protein